MVSPATLNIVSLCSGVDGLAIGLGTALEWCGLASRVVCHVEREISAAGILAARMAEGSMELAPLWSDLRTFDGRPWRGVVDCLVAGYPCQPFSLAGRRQGEDDPRHLFPEVLRLADETGAPILFLENVAAHLRMGFATVRGALEARGYCVQAGIFSALEVGASHRRERLFILAYLPLARGRGISEPKGRFDATDAHGRIAELGNAPGDDQLRPEHRNGTQRQVSSGGSSVLLAHAGSEHGRKGWHEQPGQRRQSAPAVAGVPLANANGEQAHEQLRGPGESRQQQGGTVAAGGEAARPADGQAGHDDHPGLCQGVADTGGGAGAAGTNRAGRKARANPRRRNAGPMLDNPASARCDGAGIGAAANGQGGQRVSGAGCADLADAKHGTGGTERESEPGQWGSASPAHVAVLGGVGSELADAYGYGLRAGGERECGSSDLASGDLDLFAPGPGDDRWPGILQTRAHLAPAVEPGIRVLADGVAVVVDQSRADQLRAAGNGVVPLCAAHAFITLAREGGLI